MITSTYEAKADGPGVVGVVTTAATRAAQQFGDLVGERPAARQARGEQRRADHTRLLAVRRHQHDQ